MVMLITPGYIIIFIKNYNCTIFIDSPYAYVIPVQFVRFTKAVFV